MKNEAVKEKQEKPKMSAKKKSSIFLGVGGFITLVGAVVAGLWLPLYHGQLRRMMTLTPDSLSFDFWSEPPVPIFLECTMWNITNVDEIRAGKNVSLKLVEMGPYVYREYQVKRNIVWNDNDTVTFNSQRFWHFDPDLSNGSLSDLVTSINPIIASAAHMLRHQRTSIKLSADVFLRMFHDDLFLTANVSSWLFDGIDDPALDITALFPALPLNIPYEKFSYFYQRNGSIEHDGTFVMNTGASDFSQLGNMELWQHSNRTVYRDACGVVRGSMGELWAPQPGQPEVFLFLSDVCTYLTLTRSGTVTVEGITGVEYSANSSLFDNGYRYPERACYCAEVRDENCLPAGTLNVSSCHHNAPAFMSLPHLLHADPYYPSKLEGLNPTDAHNFKLVLQKHTGVPLAVSGQLQINFLIRHIHPFSINNWLPDPDTLVPMFWFQQRVELSDRFARLLRLAENVRPGIAYGLYALTAIGVALLITGVTILVRSYRKPSDTEHILPHSTSEVSVSQ